MLRGEKSKYTDQRRRQASKGGRIGGRAAKRA